MPFAPELEQRHEAGLPDAFRGVGAPAMIDDDRGARAAQHLDAFAQLIAFALDVDLPAALATLREQSRHRGMPQHADAVG